jgi:prephenate dehydrogenase
VPAAMLFQRVAVIGVGLIGGSFALALKQAKACGHVAGIGRSPKNLEVALGLGAIDSVASDVSGCDLVLVATPVAQFPRVFADLAKTLRPDALVTDGGSTKRDVIAAARAALGARVAQFVPAHPIAGSERSGAAAADAGLFRDKRVILTPLRENAEASVQKIRGAWQACGARVSSMDAEEHDSVLSTVSHLPHLLAYALAQEVATRDNARRLFEIAGAGFRDFTRLASSSPEMWRDICLNNRDMLLADLARFEAKLGQMKRLLSGGDAAGVQRMFEEAQAARERWLNSSN